jgi:DNA polymerase-3 subunit alpha
MTTLEELGLLKMDFLGLRTLTVIQNAEKLVNRDTSKKLDMSKIDYSDKGVYELIGSGKDEGVFQLESGGMKSFMKELKPQNIEDIIAGISLYRPGPMDFIPQYIKGKNNQDAIVYDCPQLEPILKPTYGCIVYQEQVMQIVRDLAGYSWGRSDLVRRAMSKKKGSVMEKERKNFIYGNPEENVPGCIANGISEAVANKIYDEMIDFAKYAFNKSHAACYAVVAYQTAYLKLHYPVEFMAALMTSVMGNAGKITEYVLICRQMNIEILPPDVNEGEWDFSVSGNSIRYGMSAIKNIGRPVVEAIVLERNLNGRFKDLNDFVERMTGLGVNKRCLENLIKAGAMDSLNANRHQMMLGYTSLVDDAAQDKKNEISGQMDLFSLLSEEDSAAYKPPLPDVPEYDKEELLGYEKEVMGIYVSGHPLEDYESLMKKNITAASVDFEIDEETGEAHVKDQQNVIVGGIIVSKNVRNTKSGKMMAILTIEDLFGTVEVLVFPRDYEKNRQLIVEDSKVFIAGKASVRDEKKANVLLSRIVPFEQVPRQLWFRFPDKNTFLDAENELYACLSQSDGNDEVIIYCEKEKIKKVLPKNMTVNAGKELLANLYEKFGENNVKVVEKSIEN